MRSRRGAVQCSGSSATRRIRCSEYPRRPNRRPPGQADPPFQPGTKVGKSKFTAWRLSRLGAFIWKKWWRVFWAILFWLAFLRSLTTLGLSGVELVTSDAHQGLKNAIAAVFAGASWQRCRTHFMANLLTRVPKRAQPGVATQDLVAWYAPSTSNCLPPRSTANWVEWWNNSRSPFPRWPSCWADAMPNIL